MKTVSESRRKIIYEELDYLEKEGLIDRNKSEEIKSKYEVKTQYEFINIVILFSVALISIGIIGFATLNWHKIPDNAKIASLILLLIVLLSSAIYMERKNTVASTVLYCLGMVEYGAAIYIIKSIMNFTENGNFFTEEPFIWALGVTPLVVLKKKKAINIIYSLGLIRLAITASSGIFMRSADSSAITIISLIVVSVFIAINYYVAKKMDWDNVSFIFANIAMFVFLIVLMDRIVFFGETNTRYIAKETFLSGNFKRAIVYVPAFIFGMLLERKYSNKKKRISFEGNVFHFIAALLFLNTIYTTWRFGSQTGSRIAQTLFLVVLGGLYVVYLMTKVRKGSTVNIIFSAIVLVNIYTVLSSKYISKSLIFLGSGLILLLAALYIKRKGSIRISEGSYEDSHSDIRQSDIKGDDHNV